MISGRLERPDALRVAADPRNPRTSAIRPVLAFRTNPQLDYNFSLKRICCNFAQPIGVTSDPRITFSYLLKNRASTLELSALLVPYDPQSHYSRKRPLSIIARCSIAHYQRRRPGQTCVEPVAA